MFCSADAEVKKNFYLTMHIAAAYLIPLFIELPKIGNLTLVLDLIAKALEIKGIQPDNITKLKLYKKFLFILDGYDEIPDKLKLLQQYNFNHEGGWQGKILISCSTQHLTTAEEQLLYLKYPNESLYQAKERFIKSCIVPFSKQQINQYITSFIDNNVFHAISRWCRRKHPNKSKTWIVKKYFSREGNNNWKFTGTKITAKGQIQRLVLESMSLIPIRRHKKIIGEATSYDPTYAEYFKKRTLNKSRNTWMVMPITA